ncbi:MAG: hypothetical protein WCT10_00075 [Patescibacteria group bacterium]|jgi:hypothetical protein
MSVGEKLKKTIRLLPLIAAVAVLAVMTVIAIRAGLREAAPGPDLPPVIDLTWTPLGPLDLRDFKGRLTISDDRALDFTTYRFRLVELDKTVDLPIPGMMGKEYGQDIFLGLIASDPKLADKSRLTIEVSIKDDAGQQTSIRRVVRLKPAALDAILKTP